MGRFLSLVLLDACRLWGKRTGLAGDGDPLLSTAVNGVISSLHEYLQVFGNKPCYYDLSSFLEILSQYPEASTIYQQSLLSGVENGVKRPEAQAEANAEGDGGHDEAFLRRSLNELKVALALEARGPRSGPFLVRLAKVLCALYAISVHVTQGVDKDEFDANISFEYLIAIVRVGRPALVDSLKGLGLETGFLHTHLSSFLSLSVLPTQNTTTENRRMFFWNLWLAPIAVMKRNSSRRRKRRRCPARLFWF